MKRSFLMLLVAALNVCAWGQYYKFSSTAQGNLYTEANGGSVATTPEGDVCNQNYYVKSNYAPTDAPSKETTKAFSVKTYYVNIDGNYSCAFGQAYDEEKSYATASATLLEGESLNTKLTQCYVFTSSVGNCWYKVADDYVKVKEGDICSPTETYYWDLNNLYRTNDGNTIIGWGSITKLSSSFSSTDGVFVCVDGIYVALTSPIYDDSKYYYTVEFESLSYDQTSIMASSDANFSITEVVTGLNGVNKIYYYNSGTASYVEVQNGDEYLGDNAYYKEQASFALRTPAELCTLGYANQVSGLVSLDPSDFEKILTIECAGDVCDPNETFESDGYKFNSNVTGVVFSDEDGTEVSVGDVFHSSWTYFTREQLYKQQDIDVYTQYILKDASKVYSYDTDSKTYTVVAPDTDVTEGQFYTLSLGGEVADMSGYIENRDLFTASSVKNIYKARKDWQEWNSTYSYWDFVDVVEGEEYNEENVYVKSNTYNNPSGGVVEISKDDLSAQSYISAVEFIKEDADVYVVSGENQYIIVNGTRLDNEKTYYSGLTPTLINQKTDAYSTSSDIVNTNGTEYFTLSDAVYTLVSNGASFTGNQSDYYVKNGFEYTSIAQADLNNTYLASATVAANYWQALVNEINANGYETVILETAEGESDLALICNTVTRTLLNAKTIKTLDLGKVQIDHFESYDAKDGETPLGTFFDYTKHYSNKANAPIEKLVLPHIKSGHEVNGKMHYHVPTNLCTDLSLTLHEIVMPDNATCLMKQAFGAIELHDITLNEGLRMVGDEAFNNMHEDVLVIPSTMEYIGKGAFGQGYVHDVYFLGTTAPIVEMDAFGSKAYINNNANGIPNESSDPISHGDVAKNPNYAATREFYYNGDYAAALLHLPKNLTAAQRAAYTDVTRDYHVFDTYRDASVEEQATYGQEGSNVIKSTVDNHYYVQIVKGDGHDIEYKYINGNDENQGAWTVETPTQDYIMRTFWNGTIGDKSTSISSLGAFSVSTSNSFYSGVPGAGMTGGQTSFYDYYVGSVYHWPGQSAYCRSYAVATHHILWDGNTTIAQGIVNKGGSYTARTYDINCDGDIEDEGEAKWDNGSEYIGLHQFVLVTSDVEPEQTPEEIPFKTIKGGNWYSFCYPVNMTVKQVREVFGAGTQVCKFNQVDRVVEGDDKIIKLYFTDEQCLGKGDINNIAIQANVSYMIRPSDYFDEDDVNYANMYFKFSDYQLDGRQVPQETNVKALDISSKGKVAGDDYTFIGQYMTQADGTAITMPKYSYFLRNASPVGTKVKDQLHKLSFQGGTTGKWNVNTSIVIPANGQEDKDTFFTGTSSQNLAKTTTFFGFTEDIPTEVEEVKYEMVLGAENNPGAIYNLNGQVVGNTTVGLAKGIYIQAGKKFIVR